MAKNTAEPVTPRAAAPSRIRAIWSRAIHNPRWLLMDALSRFATVRRAVRSLQKADAAGGYDLRSSRFPQVDVAKFVAALNRDGFCAGLRLPAAAIAALLRFAYESPCYGDANPRFGFRYADRSRAQQSCARVFSLASYLFWDHLQSFIDDLANDALMLSIASQYLRSKPRVTGSRLWWVFATSAKDYNSSITTSFFHYDKDDYSSLRLFFYLTPVDTAHGPHVVVRGSHVNKRVSQLISMGERTDTEIIDMYGEHNLATIFGEPGDGFAEDPYCFHRATRPVAGDRLMLEIKYATRDYNIFPAADPAQRANIDVPGSA